MVLEEAKVIKSVLGKSYDMELEVEIRKLLEKHPQGMTVHEIARQLQKKGILNENDSRVCYFQVHARTFYMPDLFEKKGSIVKLRSGHSNTNDSG